MNVQLTASESGEVGRSESALLIALRRLGLIRPTPQQTLVWNHISQWCLAIAILFSLCVGGAMWWTFLESRGYVDYVEGLVLFHQWQAHNGLNIYAPEFREQPPYSIPLYGPVFYYLASLFFSDSPSLLIGRVISGLSLVGLICVSYYILRKRFQAGRIVALAGSMPWIVLVGPFQFGLNNRVDALAILFAGIAMLVGTSCRPRMWWIACLFLVLAGFTKPSAVLAAAPALFLHYAWQHQWSKAVATAVASFAMAVLVLTLGDYLSESNFSQSIIHSNLNPWKLEQTWMLTRYVIRQPLLPGGVILAALLCGSSRSRPFAVYTLIAALVAVGTAGKVGSNTNYFIEVSWLACICWGIFLVTIQSHPRAAIGSLVLAALIFHAATRVSPQVQATAARLAAWGEVEELVAYHAARGPVLTMETGALVLAGYQPYLADPHIIARLAEADAFSDEEILRDIEAQRISAIIASQDIHPLHRGHSNWRQEVREVVGHRYQFDSHHDLFQLDVYLPVPHTASRTDSTRE